jgi:hypothetical protein
LTRLCRNLVDRVELLISRAPAVSIDFDFLSEVSEPDSFRRAAGICSHRGDVESYIGPAQGRHLSHSGAAITSAGPAIAGNSHPGDASGYSAQIGGRSAKPRPRCRRSSIAGVVEGDGLEKKDPSRGTESSNPAPSSGESSANLTPSVMARIWNEVFGISL